MKTIKKNINLILGLCLIAFYLGAAVDSVGETPTVDGPYTYSLPLNVILTLGLIFILGFNAGKNDAQNQ